MNKEKKIFSKWSCFVLTPLDTGFLHFKCLITRAAPGVNRVEEPEQYKCLGFTQLSTQLPWLLFESSSALYPVKLIYLSASTSLEFS